MHQQTMFSENKKLKITNRILIVFVFFLFSGIKINAQTAIDSSLLKKAAEWTNNLNLNDNSKATVVKNAIYAHLVAVRDWHNNNAYTLVPAGINPTSGNMLSQLDREVIICSTKPKSIHNNLMNALYANLDSAQVEKVLDSYTVGKVAFTLKGYQAIVPDLTEKELTEILKNLKQARLLAIDFKSMKEISAIFEIYKTKCEQYLNNNGRSWKQLYKAYTDKIKAEKQKKN